MARRARGLGRIAAALVALCLAPAPSRGATDAAPPLPRFDGQARIGVAGCGGPCHARQSALGVAEGAAMRGDEILVWQDPATQRGRHAQAFKALTGARGREIGRRLGIGDPAAAAQCLSCHADSPGGVAHGSRARLADGVSCEACHGGGGGRWLATHSALGATHAQNVAAGMYPTDRPQARARLCESCHLGSAASDQYVTHAMMSAGHPRLVYEVELFTALQAHHFVDADYAKRKPVPARAKVWAVGQAQALRQSLRLFLDSPHARAGVFPEETFFDCRSCHRPISDKDDAKLAWRPNPGRPPERGAPVFNDANLLMLVAAARAVSPTQAAALDARGRDFHAALQGDPAAVHAAGEALLAQVAAVEAAVGSAAFDPALTRAVLREVVSASLGERLTAYAAAEQAIMAVDSLTRALGDAGPSPQPAKAELDAAYRTVDDPNAYDQAAFRAALSRVAGRLGLS